LFYITASPGDQLFGKLCPSCLGSGNYHGIETFFIYHVGYSHAFVLYLLNARIEVSRDSHCLGTALKTRLLLGNSFVSKQHYQIHR
jgi:hypothetical protein